MAMKTCPVCGKDKSTTEMYYCPKCNMFFCKDHVGTSGLFGTGAFKCPRGHTIET